jgi:DNA-binding NtrC family response regulator
MTMRLIGSSKLMCDLRERMSVVAQAMETTLIVGPTGSGKEVVAHLLHEMSPRRRGPLVAVGCAALPEGLFEAELFGHVRGAFTGAAAERAGLIRTAIGGTLLLDDVDGLAPTAQAKLLRFLETKEYRPVGSDRVDVADVWLIAATNVDLRAEVAQRRFRSDLYFRLDGIRIDIPSLAKRGDDVIEIAELFMAEFAGLARSSVRFTERALDALRRYPWPGNVRELRQRIRAVTAVARGGWIDAEDLGLVSDPSPDAAGSSSAASNLSEELWSLLEDGLTMPEIVSLCEKVLVDTAIRNEDSRVRAAQRLGVSLRTLYKKINESRQRAALRARG